MPNENSRFDFPESILIHHQPLIGALFLIFHSRYELRVRYLPKSFHELYAKDKVTFYYLYDQVCIEIICKSSRQAENGQ